MLTLKIIFHSIGDSLVTRDRLETVIKTLWNQNESQKKSIICSRDIWFTYNFRNVFTSGDRYLGLCVRD